MALSQEHLDPSYASPKPSYVYVELPKALDDHLEPPVALDKHEEHLDSLKYVKYSDTPYDLKTIYDLDDTDSIDLTLDHTLHQILLLVLLLTILSLPIRLTYPLPKPSPASRMCRSYPSPIPAHIALMFLILCAIPTISAVPTCDLI